LAGDDRIILNFPAGRRIVSTIWTAHLLFYFYATSSFTYLISQAIKVTE